MPRLPFDPRLRVLASTRLLDSAAEPAFDRFTRLTARMLAVPVALVSLVDADRVFFKSAIGLDAPWAALRETPLTHSFCPYTTRDRAALVVNDAREHPVLRDNLAVRDLAVVAYAGVPLIVENQAIGALCAIDHQPRTWTADELALLQDLADATISEIELRIALRTARSERALVETLLESLGDGVLAIDAEREFLIANEAARRLFPTAVAGVPLPADWATQYRSMREDGTPLPPDDGALARGLRGEPTIGLTFTIQALDAPQPTWVEVTGQPVRDADDHVVAAVAVYRDVTEKKRRSDLYDSLAANIPRAAVILYDAELRCLAIDGGLARTFGIDPRDAVGSSIRELAGLPVDSRRFDRMAAIFRAALAGEPQTTDLVHRDRVLSVHASPVRDARGRTTSGIALLVDVTEERRVAAALRRGDQVYRAIVEHLPLGAIFLVDRDLRYVAADGPVVADIMQRANLTQLVGCIATEIVAETNRAEIIAIYRKALAGELWHGEVQRGDSYYDLTAAPIFDGTHVTHALLSLYDVTARKAELAELHASRARLEQHAQELQAASVTDELTGLLNRRGFLLVADPELKLAARNHHKRVLVFLDLNGMKTINDTLGHHIGDLALVETAGVLRRVFRSSDVMARLGGDEFVVLASGVDAEVQSTLVERVHQAVAAFNDAGAAPFRLSISVGTAVYDGAAPIALEQLLSQADTQMYEQKRQRAKSTRIKVL